MIEERKFRSVSLSSDLIYGVEDAIEKKKAEIGEVLLPPEFKSAASFIAESTRQHLLQLQKAKQSRCRFGDVQVWLGVLCVMKVIAEDATYDGI